MYILCYACDCVLADKFIKVKVGISRRRIGAFGAWSLV